MRKLKKTVSVFLTVICIFSMLSIAFTARAADAQNSIQINKRAYERIEEVEFKLEETAENLLSQPSAVGSIGGEWAVIGLARSGKITADYAINHIKNITDYVANIGSAKLHRTKSTENSRVVLALTSLGQDVTNISGYNLLSPLYDF